MRADAGHSEFVWAMALLLAAQPDTFASRRSTCSTATGVRRSWSDRWSSLRSTNSPPACWRWPLRTGRQNRAADPRPPAPAGGSRRPHCGGSVSATDHEPADPVDLLTDAAAVPGRRSADPGCRRLSRDRLQPRPGRGAAAGHARRCSAGRRGPPRRLGVGPLPAGRPPLVLAAARAIGLGPRSGCSRCGASTAATPATPDDRGRRRPASAGPVARRPGSPGSPRPTCSHRPASGCGIRRCRASTCSPSTPTRCTRRSPQPDFDVDPTVTLPFDVRRLPARRAGTRSRRSPPAWTSPSTATTAREGLQAEMSAAARMARPVANLVVGTLKTRAAMRSGRRRPSRCCPPVPGCGCCTPASAPCPENRWAFSDPSRGPHPGGQRPGRPVRGDRRPRRR